MEAYTDLMLWLHDKKYSMVPGGNDLIYLHMEHDDKVFKWGLFINSFSKYNLCCFLFNYGKFCGENQIEVNI